MPKTVVGAGTVRYHYSYVTIRLKLLRYRIVAYTINLLQCSAGKCFREMHQTT